MKTRIATCWDDGVCTDLRLIEIFRKYQAKATFNLCPGRIPELTVYPHRRPFRPDDSVSWDRGFHAGHVGMDLLRETYQDFEVATHCWLHENARKVDPEAFLDSAVRTRKFLEETFQRECTGFAWPYGDPTPETAALLKKAGFTYGRTTQYLDDIRNQENKLCFNSSCHFMAADFWKKFQYAKENTGVFYFWGHSYEMRDDAAKWIYMDHLVHALSADPDTEWVNVVDLAKD